ncbi:MAG: agmatine deiminase [Sulfurimonas sp.]|jgi:agmatine deiminase|uniref:agmatine deiminase family protein n=1 Tax=Sulfurimonas sp. TaxID=2022749 RepID=UPI0039E477E8
MKRFIAEFEEQSFTQIIFPHKGTDWVEYLTQAEEVFINIIKAIALYQKCFIICADITYVKSLFSSHDNLYFAEHETDDTWARDCSALSVEIDGEVTLLDFTFNAWGNKFESSKDNNLSLAMQNIYLKDLKPVNFVLEGGAVESNGEGVILTTSACLLNKNRNPSLDSIQITKKLVQTLGSYKIHYLQHGYLAGDDTDSHIDTLARFISEDTIMYIKCEDTEDEHYQELQLMEKELQSIAKDENFTLIALPFASPIYNDSQRLPATYANFLFVNGAVLVPVYNIKEDETALEVFKNTFINHEIIPIDCSTLIKQHGSLHCVTMNFPRDVRLLI